MANAEAAIGLAAVADRHPLVFERQQQATEVDNILLAAFGTRRWFIL